MGQTREGNEAIGAPAADEAPDRLGECRARRRAVGRGARYTSDARAGKKGAKPGRGESGDGGGHPCFFTLSPTPDEAAPVVSEGRVTMLITPGLDSSGGNGQRAVSAPNRC